VKKLTRRATATLAITAAAVTFIGVGIAHAATYTEFGDPSGKLINGFGSETIQDVTGALTQSGSCDVAGNWNSINPSTGALADEVTPVSGGDTFQRPNGSGDGRQALSAAWNPSDSSWTSPITNDVQTLTASTLVKEEEITYARSSSQPALSSWSQNNGGVNDLSFIPQATDAVGVGEQTFDGSTATGTEPVTTFSQTQLFDLYTDTTTTSSAPYAVGDIVNEGASAFPDVVTAVTRAGAISTEEPIVAVLPEASSGTRSFFTTATGFGNADTGVTNPFDGTTVANENGNAAQEENDANEDLNAANIQAALNQNTTALTLPTGDYVTVVPFSAAQLVEQEHGLTSSTIGTASFPSITATVYVDDKATSETLTLWNDVSGSGAATGTLNTDETPVQSSTGVTTSGSDEGQTLVGDYARYVYIALPSSLIAGDPPAALANASTLVTCVESTWPGSTSTWTDYGFVSVGSTFASTSSNWILTDWLN
jgi:hypothetical protein